MMVNCGSYKVTTYIERKEKKEKDKEKEKNKDKNVLQCTNNRKKTIIK